MTVVNKIKQLNEVKIVALVAMAKSELVDKSDTAIARWIISHSPHWRNQGYKRIIEEMHKLERAHR